MCDDKDNEYTAAWLGEQDREYSFEVELSRKRREYAARTVRCASRVLEVGPGIHPLFTVLNGFNYYVGVEPNNKFVEQLKEQGESRGSINIVHGRIEEVSIEEGFDAAVVSSVLHEVSNPSQVLDVVYDQCSAEAVIHVNVPNPNSFHRILASKLGIVGDVKELSERDEAFNREQHFDKEDLTILVESCGFTVIDYGTYVVKPFTSKQIELLVSSGQLPQNIIEGLEGMTEYLPEMGCEMFLEVTPEK